MAGVESGVVEEPVLLVPDAFVPDEVALVVVDLEVEPDPVVDPELDPDFEDEPELDPEPDFEVDLDAVLDALELLLPPPPPPPELEGFAFPGSGTVTSVAGCTLTFKVA